MLNNGVHDSVGGQETVGFKIDFCKIAEACNFDAIFKCSDKIELENAMLSKEYNNSPSFIEVLIHKVIDFKCPLQLLNLS